MREHMRVQKAVNKVSRVLLICSVLLLLFFYKRVEGREESPHPQKKKKEKKGKKGERDEEREREREQTTAASSISHYIEYSV